MNWYGATMMQHWARSQPVAYAEISDPRLLLQYRG